MKRRILTKLTHTEALLCSVWGKTGVDQGPETGVVEVIDVAYKGTRRKMSYHYCCYCFNGRIMSVQGSDEYKYWAG